MSSRSDPEGRRSASSAWGTHVIVLPGRTPNTVEAMAHGAIAFLEALDLQRVDLLGFSIGSFVAQEIALIRPGLLRRVMLASSAPQGAPGIHGWAPEVIGAVGAPEPNPQGYLDVFFAATGTLREHQLGHPGIRSHSCSRW